MDASGSATADEIILEDNGYRYRVDSNWGKLPEGWWWDNVSSIAIDRHDRVFVFARCEHPVTVFNRDGNFITSWGEGQFRRPHHAFIAPDDTIYLTDDAAHVVKKFDLDGNLLMTLGEVDKPSGLLSGNPFNRCTSVALSPTGDIYVSDGYSNCRVHKFSPEGKHLLSWGAPGCRDGQFNVVHGVLCDSNGLVYVNDRENHRVQVFDGEGRLQAIWHGFHRPNGFYMTEHRGSRRIYLGEESPPLNMNKRWWGIGPWISIFDDQGKRLASLGDGKPGYLPGQFMAPHAVAVDSHDDIYVGEVSKGSWKTYFEGEPPARVKCLQKLVKLE